jgi:hypothetical protein
MGEDELSMERKQRSGRGPCPCRRSRGGLSRHGWARKIITRVAGILLLSWAAASSDGGLLALREAAAQQSRLAVSVASQLQAEPGSRVRLPIQIAPQDAVQKNSFVRVRGLPPSAALSEGHAIAPGAWAVPLGALPSLTIILPAGVQGRSEVAISLVNIDGDLLAETRTFLVVAPPPPPVAASTMVRQEQPPVRLTPMPLSPAERERALDLHQRGQEQIERGNIVAARKFFERAVAAGLARSAVALAATYDPDELSKLNVLGLQPDVEAARKWYEKARELGAVEASERLRRLGAR